MTRKMTVVLKRNRGRKIYGWLEETDILYFQMKVIHHIEESVIIISKGQRPHHFKMIA